MEHPAWAWWVLEVQRGPTRFPPLRLPSAWQVYHPLESEFVLKVRRTVQVVVATEEGRGLARDNFPGGDLSCAWEGSPGP